MRGNLVANTAAVTQLLTAGALSSAGVATVAGIRSTQSVSVTGGLSTSDAITASGSASLVGSVLLGDDNLYTIVRRVYSSANGGRSTYLLGQGAGTTALTMAGGDLCWRAVPQHAGVVKIGLI